MSTPAFQPHDHSHCVHDALHEADRLARRAPDGHPPPGAGTGLGKPSAAGGVWHPRPLDRRGHKPAPPTVYRALDFLLEQGLVHRIASLNAYMGCADPAHQHLACFFLCESCGNAEELEDSRALMQALQASAGKRGFRIRQPLLEIGGLCRACRDGGEAAGA
jgi:Fur family zinc uptake transcriptional regulator